MKINYTDYELLLASKSPRRRQLLSQLGFPVRFVDINVDETLLHHTAPNTVAELLANRKCEAYNSSELLANQILITADTVVVIGKDVLGKPHSRDEAVHMLLRLSGQCNHVYTGVAMRSHDLQSSFTERSDVYFRSLENWEIDYYLDHFTYQDKAGSYGIQEWIGLVGVERIEGCYYNVMGLPITHLYTELLQLIRKSESIS